MVAAEGAPEVADHADPPDDLDIALTEMIPYGEQDVLEDYSARSLFGFHSLYFNTGFHTYLAYT